MTILRNCKKISKIASLQLLEMGHTVQPIDQENPENSQSEATAMTDAPMAESRNLEWKSSWRDEYLKWICGSANAHGGVLVIGKNDRGEIVGVKDPLRLLEEIPNKVLSLLGIVVDVDLKSEAGGEYLEIRVDPCPNTISYKGEYHHRSGSTKQVLRCAALNQFLLRKHGCNWDDAPMPGVGLADLDGRTLDEFRRRGVTSGWLPADAVGRIRWRPDGNAALAGGAVSPSLQKCSCFIPTRPVSSPGRS